MKLPRLHATLIVALLLTLVIALVAPHQLPVTLYKLSLITVAGVAGYWLDRELSPYARPDRYLDENGYPVAGCEQVAAAAMLRRALVVAACIIGVGLGA